MEETGEQEGRVEGHSYRQTVVCNIIAERSITKADRALFLI
jgi:hypothetical protein